MYQIKCINTHLWSMLYYVINLSRLVWNFLLNWITQELAGRKLYQTRRCKSIPLEPLVHTAPSCANWAFVSPTTSPQLFYVFVLLYSAPESRFRQSRYYLKLIIRCCAQQQNSKLLNKIRYTKEQLKFDGFE